MRKIVHFDLDAFFCAVEEQRDSSLQGVAFAVGGRPDARGVVASCSYPARRYGVHSALPMSLAVKLCPDLVVVPASHGVYSKVSRRVMAILHDVTEQVEQMSIDEAFLDVSEREEPASVLASHLQRRVMEELDLPASLGVATNKLVAKIATDVGKKAKLACHAETITYPNAIQVVPPGQEGAFLAPLPATALWGVGPKTADKLAELGMTTIGDIAAFSVELLERHLGKIGRELHRRAQGIDSREVTTSRERKSISQENTFAQDVRAPETLRREIQNQAASISRRLHNRNLTGTTVKLKLRWPDFTTLTRQATLDHPTDKAGEIARIALRLLDENRAANQPVRLIGVGISGLVPPIRQMTIFDVPSDREEQINDTVWSLRRRFGYDIVRRASNLKKGNT